MSRRKDAKTAWLEEHSHLYGLTHADAEALAATADITTVPAGTVLAETHQLGREAFLITSGEIEVRRDGALVATLGPGEIVGEQALMGNARRNADIVVTQDVEVAVFDVNAFRTAVERSPALRAHVERAMAERH